MASSSFLSQEEVDNLLGGGNNNKPTFRQQLQGKSNGNAAKIINDTHTKIWENAHPEITPSSKLPPLESFSPKLGVKYTHMDSLFPKGKTVAKALGGAGVLAGVGTAAYKAFKSKPWYKTNGGKAGIAAGVIGLGGAALSRRGE